jgi:maltose-binding protein MalE
MGVKTSKILSMIILALVIAAVLPGCGKGEPTEKTGEPEYAGAIAENILQAFNSGDYTAYSEYFDEAMKKAVPEAVFKATYTQIRESFGNYVSKEFSSVELNVQNIYTAVFYKAKFRKKTDGINVKVVFLETDNGVLVSGLWFQ